MATNDAMKRNRLRNLKLLAVILIICSLLLTGCTEQQVEDSVDFAVDILLEVLDSSNQSTEEVDSSTELTTSQETTEQTQSTTEIANVDGEMTVHFIDVGQSDATLFVQDDYVMLFDAAMKSRGDELVEYIQNLGIEEIDVLVLSHPHDDHMGGAAEVINNFEIGIIYGPDIFELMEKENTPVWYDDMIDAVEAVDEKLNEGISEDNQTSIWHFPRNDDGEFAKFNIGNATVEFYAPLEGSYSDKNDYSICAKITYGTIDIMMTGDATSNVEKALIKEGYDLDVEVFQASHHGSDTGNSQEFLEAMSPECVVISCGMKNRYNHPIKSVMELYKQMNIPVYRTDESGNIIMTTDGTTYSFNVDVGTYTSGAEYKGGK